MLQTNKASSDLPGAAHLAICKKQAHSFHGYVMQQSLNYKS